MEHPVYINEHRQHYCQLVRQTDREEKKVLRANMLLLHLLLYRLVF